VELGDLGEGRAVMNAITGTWKNGQFVLDEPAHWPEGSQRSHLLLTQFELRPLRPL
jgi:hypothetical protein